MVKVTTLGECLIEVNGVRIAPDSKVLFGLLLLLVLERRKKISRVSLVEMFWPGSPSDKAAHSLRQTIYQCRKLGVEIEATKIDVSLPAALIVCDIDELDTGTSANQRPAACEFLPGYNPDVSEAFSTWLDRHRSIVHAKVRRQLLIEMANRKAAGEWEGASTIARELLQIDPLNEEGTLVLAEATAMAGNKAEALHILDAFARDVDHNHQLMLPATVLRKRIAEQFKESDRAGTPLIGRADVLAEVNQLLRHARKGEGRTVLFWGPPGIGKSRLIAEVEKTAQLQGFQVAKVECHIADGVRPLSAFTEIVPQLLQLRGALGCSPDSLSLLKRLIAFDPDRNAANPEYEGAAELAGHVRRALIDLLDALVAESALALIIEDVHWLDKASWELFCVLSKWGTSNRIFLVHTSRVHWPLNAPPEGGESFMRIPLHPLNEADARNLFLASCSPRASALRHEDHDWHVTVADGNPYFVIELARHRSDKGELFTIPASLESLLSDRLRRLSPAALRLMQVTSILGRQSTFDRWEKVLEIEAFDLLAALEELEMHGLVVTNGEQVNAKHALLADNSLKLCTPATRRLLHRRVAQILEAEALDTSSAALLWTCTEHWRLAGEQSRATQLAHSGASHLFQLGLITEAIGLLEDLLTTVRDPSQQCDILSTLGRAYRTLHNYAKAVEVLELLQGIRRSAQDDSNGHSDDELLLIEAHSFNEFLSDTRREHEFVAKLLACTRAVESTANHRLQAARWGLIIADNSGFPEDMDKIHVAVQPLLEAESVPQMPRLWVRMIYETVRGDLDEGVKIARQLVLTCRAQNGFGDLLRALTSASIPFRYAGYFDEAETSVREALSLSHHRKIWGSYLGTLDIIAAIQLVQGQFDEALCTLEKAFVKVHEAQHNYTGTSLTIVAIQARLGLGDFEGARRLHAGLAVPRCNTKIRGREYTVATQLILDAVAGLRSDPGLITDLYESHMVARRSGRRDFATAGLAIALTRRGEVPRAEHLLLEYLQKDRRERYPLPQHVREVLLRASPELYQLPAIQRFLRAD